MGRVATGAAWSSDHDIGPLQWVTPEESKSTNQVRCATSRHNSSSKQERRNHLLQTSADLRRRTFGGRKERMWRRKWSGHWLRVGVGMKDQCWWMVIGIFFKIVYFVKSLVLIIIACNSILQTSYSFIVFIQHWDRALRWAKFQPGQTHFAMHPKTVDLSEMV